MEEEADGCADLLFGRVNEIDASLSCLWTDEGSDIYPLLIPWPHFEFAGLLYQLLLPRFNASHKDRRRERHTPLAGCPKRSTHQRRCGCLLVCIWQDDSVVLGSFV